MKKLLLFSALFIVTTCSLSSAFRVNEPRYVADEIIVKYKNGGVGVMHQNAVAERESNRNDPDASKTGLTKELARLDEKYHPVKIERLGILKVNGAEFKKSKSWLRNFKRQKMLINSRKLFRIKFDRPIDVKKACEEYAKSPLVEYAEPNYIGQLSAVPNDEYYSSQVPDFSRIDIEDAWDIQTGSSDVTVAVIDSGIDATHPDLISAIDPNSYDFVSDTSTLTDDIGHGTRVAGIIAAEGNNVEGIAGIAYGCKVLVIDVTDLNVPLTTSRVIEAINYAVAQDAGVINMSFQFYAESQSLNDTCDDASEVAVLVGSAGNENQSDSLTYPAGFDSVIGVAASDESDERASFSNYNSDAINLVDLCAPGVTIFSTVPGGLYDENSGSGTSFAAPIVSGLATLLKSKYPNQSPAAIRQHLLAHATYLGDWAGSGLVDAYNTILWL